MDRQETIKFLALVKVAYPTAYKDMDKDAKLATVNMWLTTFPTTPFVIMELAFDHFRRVSKYPPTVAEMYDELKNLYCQAVVDANSSLALGDSQRAEKCKWIIAHTSEFRGNRTAETNYSMIDESHLLMLPDSGRTEEDLKYEELC